MSLNCKHEWRKVIGEFDIDLYYCVKCLAEAEVSKGRVRVEHNSWR